MPSAKVLEQKQKIVADLVEKMKAAMRRCHCQLLGYNPLRMILQCALNSARPMSVTVL